MSLPPSTFFPLESLLEMLRENGFPVGVDSYLRVQTLLNHTDAYTSPAELKTLLAPMFSRSEREQRKFYRLYDTWFRQLTEEKSLPDRGTEQRKRRRKLAIHRFFDLISNRWLLLSLATLSVAAGVWMVLQVYGALAGTDGKPGMKEYLQTYGLTSDGRYQEHVTNYLTHSVLGGPQACDWLDSTGFTLDTRLLPDGTYEISLKNTSPDTTASYLWDLGNGTRIRNVREFVYTVSDSGSYVVRLEALNAYGCRVLRQKNAALTPEKTCTAEFAFTLSPQNPLQVTFSDSSVAMPGDRVVSREWNFGDDEQHGDKKAHTSFVYSEYREYKVCLSIRTEKGCTDDICRIVRLAGKDAPVNLLPLSPQGFIYARLSDLPKPDFWKSIWLILLLSSLLIGFFYEMYQYFHRRAVKSRERSEYGPLTWRIRMPGLPGFWNRDRLFRAATQLRRRQESEEKILSIHQTIDATLQAGGFPVFVYQPGSRPSEYLALVEQRSVRDHQSGWYEKLLLEISSQDVYVDFYFHPPEFSVFRRSPDARPLTLDELKARHPNHRLLILGEGDGLLDGVTGLPLPVAYEMLSWNERAVLSPVPRREWGFQEMQLASFFQVLDATADSLGRLPDLFDPEKNVVQKLGGAGREDIPSGEAALQPERWRDYLGEKLFVWMSACAVYTECHWDLTEYLGRVLEPAPGAWVNEETLLSLARIPFFRNGTIPDELRLKLVDGLEKGVLRKTRQALMHVLECQVLPENSFAAERRKMQMSFQKWELREGEPGKRKISDDMRDMAERNEIDDMVVMHHIQTGKGTWAARIGEAARAAFFREGMVLLGLKPWLRISLALGIISLFILPNLLHNWSNNLKDLITPGRLLRIEGQFYQLKTARDSALYFSYQSGKAYDTDNYAASYNLVSQAVDLDPFNPLYYYQRGLANFQLVRRQPSDSLLTEVHLDFIRSRELCPVYSADLSFQPLGNLQEGQLSQALGFPLSETQVLASGNEVRLFPGGKSDSVKTYTHPDPIWAIDVSKDGAFTAAASGKSAFIWDNRSGQQLGQLSYHLRRLRTVRFSSGGEYVITGADDNLAVIWNRVTLRPLHVLEFIHTGPVWDAAFSPDKKYVVTASYDSTAVIWDRATGEFVSILEGMNQPVVSAAFTSDSRWVITAGSAGDLMVWDLAGDSLGSRIRTGMQKLQTLSLRSGSSVAGISGQMAEGLGFTHQIWDWAAGKRLAELPVTGLPGTTTFNYAGNFHPATSFFANGAQVMAVVPGKGLQSFTTNAYSEDSLSVFASYNDYILSYYLRKFPDAISGMELFSKQPRLQTSATYAQGVAVLQYLVLQTTIRDTALFMRGIRSLTAAAARDPAYKDSLSACMPLILDIYNNWKDLPLQKETFCDLIEKVRPGSCSIFVYEEVQAYSEGYAAVRQGSLWGYIDSTQRLVIPLRFGQASSFSSGLAMVQTRGTKYAQMINSKGRFVYNRVQPLSEGFMAVRDSASGKWGYLDTDFDLIIPPEYEEADDFHRGYAKVRQGNSYGFIAMPGRPEPFGGLVYSQINGNFARDTVLTAYQGKTRIQLRLSDAMRSQRAPEILPESSGEVPYDNLNGYQVMGDAHEGLSRVLCPDKQYGFIGSGEMRQQTNKGGASAPEIPCQYEDARDFSNGRAAVKEPGGLWGFIDVFGKLVIGFQYESAASFSGTTQNAVALVTREGQTYYIDLNGECVESKEYPCPAIGFSNSKLSPNKGNFDPKQEFYPVEVNGTTVEVFLENGKWGLRRTDGTVLASAQFSNRFTFSEGLARVQIAGKWGFLNPEGKMSIATLYDDALDFSDGLAAVKISKQWGYIDVGGKEVIPPAFESARSFVRGKAIVRNGKDTFRIDRKGKRIAERQMAE